MAADSTSEEWGQLVSTCDTISEPIILNKSNFVIGRSKAADLSLLGNKLVSGSHCVISREEDGTVYLQDTSSNGTLINLKEKLNGRKHKLEHGDEFHVVYKKNEEHLNVSYMYQDLARLRQEEEEESENETLDYDLNETSDTLPADTSTDSIDTPEKGTSKGHVDLEESPKRKRRKLEEEEETTAADSCDKAKSSCSGDHKQATAASINYENKDTDRGKGPGKTKPLTEGMEEDLICIICQEILHDCISCQPCMHSFCGGCYSDWMKRSSECPACRLQVDRINKNHIVNNLVSTYLKEHPDKRRPKEEIDELDKRNKITADMLRPPKPKKTMSEYIDDEDEEEEEESDADDDSSAPGLIHTSPFAPGVLAGTSIFHPTGGYYFSGMTGHTIIRPPKSVCRQCPEYVAPADTSTSDSATSTAMTTPGTSTAMTTPGTSTAVTTPGTSAAVVASGAGTGTSASGVSGESKLMPDPPEYSCSESQIHIMCQCCLKPMPDRRSERTSGEVLPEQQCVLCYRWFCHMYWGCQKTECLGCLAKFKDVNFGKKELNALILQNTYESQVLKDYLDKNGMNLRDLLHECCVRMEAGDYKCADQARGLSSSSVTCYSCALRNFRELAYQYRADIPSDQLTPAAIGRPDCYWGKHCRTQTGKLHHASKYNHICEQTRI